MPKNFLARLKRQCPCDTMSREQKLRMVSEACMVAGGVSLLGSIGAWMSGRGQGANQAGAERLGIFIGLWVPSLLLTAAYLTRKADDEAMRSSDYDEVPFFEELM